MSSSFREVLWMDTDITPLHKLELLFDSPQFQRASAGTRVSLDNFICLFSIHSRRS